MQEKRHQREHTASPSPPQTATEPSEPANHQDNEKTTEYPQQLPHDLNAIKEFIQHDKDDDYIPLMSAITLKKKETKNAFHPPRL